MIARTREPLYKVGKQQQNNKLFQLLRWLWICYIMVHCKFTMTSSQYRKATHWKYKYNHTYVKFIMCWNYNLPYGRRPTDLLFVLRETTWLCCIFLLISKIIVQKVSLQRKIIKKGQVGKTEVQQEQPIHNRVQIKMLYNHLRNKQAWIPMALSQSHLNDCTQAGRKANDFFFALCTSHRALL